MLFTQSVSNFLCICSSPVLLFCNHHPHIPSNVQHSLCSPPRTVRTTHYKKNLLGEINKKKNSSLLPISSLANYHLVQKQHTLINHSMSLPSLGSQPRIPSPLLSFLLAAPSDYTPHHKIPVDIDIYISNLFMEAPQSSSELPNCIRYKTTQKRATQFRISELKVGLIITNPPKQTEKHSFHPTASSIGSSSSLLTFPLLGWGAVGTEALVASSGSSERGGEVVCLKLQLSRRFVRLVL